MNASNYKSLPVRKILCVGLSCLDFVTVVSRFPIEDTDTRSSSQHWQRGGNASNNCTILSHLEAPCELLASLSSGSQNLGNFASDFSVDDFSRHNISTENCEVFKDCDCHCSIVIINGQTGSRTILHQKGNLPEITFQTFNKLFLGNYKWAHFEARCPEEVVQMMRKAHEWNCVKEKEEEIKISVEFEKPNNDYSALVEFADFIFMSKEFASARGCTSKEEAVSICFASEVKRGATIICPWGEQGVAARQSHGDVCSIHAYPPPIVVDTLGAGDTFIAGTIFALSNGQDLKGALSFGCRLAGHKCGMLGYTGLKSVALDMYSKHFSCVN